MPVRSQPRDMPHVNAILDTDIDGAEIYPWVALLVILMILAGPSRTTLQLHRIKDVLNVFPAVPVEYIALRPGVGDRVVNRLLQLSKHTDLIIETFEEISRR